MADEQLRQQHWNSVYARKSETEFSWYQASPEPSLGLIVKYGGPNASVIDIGGGTSNLIDGLLDQGFRDLTVLDLSAAALDAVKARLGDKGRVVTWLVDDATTWHPTRTYDIWHDRAAFHFLVEDTDRIAYVERLKRAVAVGGHVIIATFSPDGPDKCSGLPVMRHDADSLRRTFGPAFSCLGAQLQLHATPWGASQAFQFSVFQRVR